MISAKSFYVAPPGFEPGIKEPKSSVLPLHHGAIECIIKILLLINTFYYWSSGRDSNPQLSDWKSDALPIELPLQIGLSIKIVQKYIERKSLTS